MNNVQLNLARKWRSKNFDQIVGQDLSVRMLKNSLYLGHYFPVYLFSGKKGCGKTTTARVFAAAVNCEQLDSFQKNPKKAIVPCLDCTSCKAMRAGKHPDFIEMDAASHTGVDNVRQIIDAATLMPLMGRKKVYLIDEAHMLSKAAFNAFLKILEEPPVSVLFILATTDPQKIIDTVKSRCFQLFFSAIDRDKLFDHLKHVCEQERIVFDGHGLELIIKETEGSARDALNLLEQVRFASKSVSLESVQQVLGHIDDTRLLALFKLLLHNSPQQLFTYLPKLDLESFSSEFIWAKLVELVRASIWLKHGVEPQRFVQHRDTLKRIVAKTSWQQLHTMLEVLYKHENMFLRTTSKLALLEMILLQLCQGIDEPGGSSSSGSPSSAAQPQISDSEEDLISDDDEDKDYEDDEEEDDEDEEYEEGSYDQAWEVFLKDVDMLGEPIVSSVFKQGAFVNFDQDKHKLEVKFSKDMSFFQDTLERTEAKWLPLLKKKFSDKVIFSPLFTGERKVSESIVKKTAFVQSSSPAPVHKPVQKKQTFPARKVQAKQTPVWRREKKLDVSDVPLWPKSNMLLRHFPGTISEIQENLHD